MKTFVKTILVKIVPGLFAYCISNTATAQQWEKIPGLPHTQFTALEVVDETLYAAAANHLYVSSDSGFNWLHSLISNDPDLWVSCFTKFNGRLFAGTSKGIFSVNIDATSNYWNHDLYTQQVNSFTERNGVLYASVEAFGVLKYNMPGWVPFNNGLPTYSMSVTEVLDTPAGLLAIAGANGTFYRYNFTQGKWVEDYYSNDGIMAGIDMDDIISIGNTLYVSRHNNIYRSDDLGENWVEDKLGLLTGQTRKLYETGGKLYSISMIGANMTRLNKRNTTAVNASWGLDVAMLPFLTYSFRELNDILFIASSDGIYRHADFLEIPAPSKIAVTLYPNPTKGTFKIESEGIIDHLRVFDLQGRLISTLGTETGIKEFTIQQPGVYIVELTAGNSISKQKLIVY